MPETKISHLVNRRIARFVLVLAAPFLVVSAFALIAVTVTPTRPPLPTMRV